MTEIPLPLLSYTVFPRQPLSLPPSLPSIRFRSSPLPTRISLHFKDSIRYRALFLSLYGKIIDEKASVDVFR